MLVKFAHVSILSLALSLALLFLLSAMFLTSFSHLFFPCAGLPAHTYVPTFPTELENNRIYCRTCYYALNSLCHISYLRSLTSHPKHNGFGYAMHTSNTCIPIQSSRGVIGIRMADQQLVSHIADGPNAWTQLVSEMEYVQAQTMNTSKFFNMN